MKKITIAAIGTALIILFGGNISAQVTIGSTTAPKQGALLDLTQGEKTTKGMLLPRVKLESLTTLDDIAKEEVERPERLAHTGLLVFNVNSEKHCYSIQPGAYVWSGTRWLEVMGKKKTPDFIAEASGSNAIEVYPDQEGNKFLAAQMGNAGTWMLTNLAVKTYSNGQPISPYDAAAPAGTKAYTEATNTAIGKSPFAKVQGMFYNWDAATAQGVGLPANQGVCPTGWRLPTNADWLKLMKEVYNNPQQYGELTEVNSGGWNANWDQLVDYVGDNLHTSVVNPMKVTVAPVGMGSVLKNMCVESAGINPLGLSNYYNKKGFNAFLNGFMSQGHYLNQGVMAFFWTSELDAASEDNIENNRSFVVYLSAYEAGSGKAAISRNDFVNVRCVK